MIKHSFSILALSAALALAACDTSDTSEVDNGEKTNDSVAFASTYAPLPSRTTLITNANIYDGLGGEITGGYVLMTDGKVSALGEGTIGAPEGALTVDANGAWVTPGIIDIHSHLGDYASPGVRAHADGNEATSPITSEVSAEHGVWPQDPGFAEALGGGVTTLHILPGSANLFGGRGVTLRNVNARSVQEMKFPDAPYTLKMACGENPKRVYGSKGGPGSRMGNVAGYRKNWIKATEYKSKRDAGGDYTRDLQLETLADVIDGKILVQMHCYRADEMMQILDLAKEFDYKVTTFHHAIESYKIADKLAQTGTCSAVWADWWGFKMEAYDSIRENLPYLHAAGACAMIHSDSADGVQRLNQEIAKALADGNRAGLDISKAEAWQWVSLNPAKALGIDEQTGSLEVGKRADVVIWNGNPYSTYSRAAKVYLDGALVFDRAAGLKPVSDFKLGQPGTDVPAIGQ